MEALLGHSPTSVKRSGDHAVPDLHFMAFASASRDADDEHNDEQLNERETALANQPLC